jgi:hypothetical protein
VNIIFTDDKNPGIINSRFKRIDSSRLVSIADRTGTKDSNIYSDDDWDRVALIQNTNCKSSRCFWRRDFKVLEVT